MLNTGFQPRNLYLMNKPAYNSMLFSFWSESIWSDLFQRYTDPASMIISCKVYPIDLSDVGSQFITKNTSKSIRIGSRTFSIDNLDVANKQSYYINQNYTYTKIFTIDFRNYKTNSFVDYGTISEYQLYLPFKGWVDVDPYYIVNMEFFEIKYSLDICTGLMTIIVEAHQESKENFINIVRIYEDSVVIGLDVNITGNDTSILRDKMIGLISNTAQSVLGYTMPARSFSETSTTTKTTARNPNTGRQVTTGTTSQTSKGNTSYLPSKGKIIGQAIDGFVDYFNTKIPHTIKGLQQGSSISDSDNTPALLIRKPNIYYCNNYGNYFGYPLHQAGILSSFKGFTQVNSVHVNIPCTDEERNDIEQLLYDGVIIKEIV